MDNSVMMSNSQSGPLSEIYPLISDKFSEEEFQNIIKEKELEVGKLLDEGVLGYLVLMRYGKNPVNLNNLNNLENGTAVSVNVTINSIEPPREYNRKDGNIGHVINMTVEDQTGTGRVVLWDTNHHRLIEEEGIGKGTELLMINVRLKHTDYGVELNPGKKSTLRILSASYKEFWNRLMSRRYLPADGEIRDSLTDISEILNEADLERVNVKGTVTESGNLREFERKSGDKGSVLNLKIYDGTAKAHIILWDKAAVENQALNIGDIIQIENAKIKYRDNETEIHSDFRTKIKRLDSD
jgi:ssDNA-binding replication factor A large subunit